MTSHKKCLLKTESKCISGEAQKVTRVPVSMDQSAKDTRDTSDHKCILIRNPAYKYKHYKFLKYEGRVSWCSAGTKVAPKTTQSFSLQTCSSFIISSQLISSTNSF